MKLSKLFHTLYATVMALPVLIIPIFALNILHKETEPISIEVQEKISVDFNQQAQLIESTNYSSYSYTQNFNINDNIINITYGLGNSYSKNFRTTKKYNFVGGHIYVIRFEVNNRNEVANNTMGVRSDLGRLDYSNIPQPIGTSNISLRKQCSLDEYSYLYFGLYGVQSTNYTFSYSNICLFDLTQMYGVGNEPTITEFDNLYPNIYYSFTESQKMLVNKPTTTTFNSTDIGSQFVYALYKPIHDYFNFGDFFGLGGMYDWFQLNIFNGTAPLSFFIVFNVMIYWLFISLFWLLLDILIYVPMVIHKWLDKAEM